MEVLILEVKISVLQIGLLALRYTYRSWKSADLCYAIANVINFLSAIAWKADHMLGKPEDLVKEIRKIQNICLSQKRQR